MTKAKELALLIAGMNRREVPLGIVRDFMMDNGLYDLAETIKDTQPSKLNLYSRLLPLSEYW